jgi:hypothetical protein
LEHGVSHSNIIGNNEASATAQDEGGVEFPAIRSCDLIQ